jgi:hypothetical protein
MHRVIRTYVVRAASVLIVEIGLCTAATHLEMETGGLVMIVTLARAGDGMAGVWAQARVTMTRGQGQGQDQGQDQGQGQGHTEASSLLSAIASVRRSARKLQSHALHPRRMKPAIPARRQCKVHNFLRRFLVRIRMTTSARTVSHAMGAVCRSK